MGRYIGPKNKIARRFGVNLGLKTNPAKVAKRLTQAPGVHGPGKRARGGSGFSKQLLEKQKARLVYGIRENQFRRYVNKARTMKGDSGVNLQRILEMRLDNVVYRMGLGVTRAQARQMVSHKMFLVNGKPINVPSHIVKVGDEVALKDNKKKKGLFVGISERLQKKEPPSWLNIDGNALKGKVLNQPSENDFEKVFDVRLIIEYYSAR